MKLPLRILATMIVGLSSGVAPAASLDQNWDSRFVLAPGLNGNVYSMIAVGTNLYAGGAFTRIGNSLAGGLARWDGSDWHPVGGGVGGTVYTLVTDGTNIYAGGRFTSAGGIAATNIAKWNGTNWSSLGALHSPAAPNGYFALVASLLMDGEALIAAGSFYSAGGVLATNIARWDGQTWHAFGDGLGTAGDGAFLAVIALGIRETNLFAGGQFHVTGNSPLTNFARWNGESWEEVGGGLSGGRQGYNLVGGVLYGIVGTMCPTADGLLVAGDFTRAGGLNATNLARWDGTNWSAVHDRTDVDIGRIVPDGDAQILLGSFSAVGEAASHGIAGLHGTSWTSFGQGVSPAAYSAARVGTNLYVGGEFQFAGGSPAGFVAKWNGVDWQPLISGQSASPFGIVRRLAVDANGNLLVLGDFRMIGTVWATNIARYDGTSWLPLGDGVRANYSSELAVVGTNVYVSVALYTPSAGEHGLAHWDGSEWKAVGNDTFFGGPVNAPQALASGSTNLFIAGSVFAGTNVIATNLARWDGAHWYSLDYPVAVPPGCFFSILAMATAGEELFICQSLECSGSRTLQIRRWTGEEWSDIGEPLAPTGHGWLPDIRAMHVISSNVIVVGGFTVSQLAATNIVRWDGLHWTGMASPFHPSGILWAMAGNGTNLFVGGFEAESGGKPALAVAKWNEGAWTTLGSGVATSSDTPIVMSLALHGRNLFVGGRFSMAGGKPADNLALWRDFPEVTLSAKGWLSGSGFGLRIHGGNDQLVRVQSSTNLSDWTDFGNQLPTSDPFDFSDPTAEPEHERFYRLILVP